MHIYIYIYILKYILFTDIVFVRTWYPVEVPKFYNPVTTLMLPSAEKNQWLGMKTVGQLRREKGITRDVDPDHLYKVICHFIQYII